jgi:hypothetical protein
MAVARIAAVTAVLSLAACAGGKAAPPPAARPPDAAAAAEAPAPAASAAKPLPATGLELFVEPASAEVLVDGEARGVVSELSSGVLALAPGIYQVSLKAPGYVTWRAEVAVRGGREKIEVRLARKDPAPR